MKKEEYARKYPIRLNRFSDFFTLGIFAGKTNTVDYFMKNKKQLVDGSDLATFNLGIADADLVSFDDIAFDMAYAREFGPKMFDEYIAKRAGDSVRREIVRATEGAKDWETDEQKSFCSDIVQVMNR